MLFHRRHKRSLARLPSSSMPILCCEVVAVSEDEFTDASSKHKKSSMSSLQKCNKYIKPAGQPRAPEILNHIIYCGRGKKFTGSKEPVRLASQDGHTSAGPPGGGHHAGSAAPSSCPAGYWRSLPPPMPRCP